MNTRFDTEARIAVTQAADIARELDHHEVGPDHLLLGLLANPRGTAYAALTGHGLTLEAARAIVAERHVDPVDPSVGTAEPGQPPPTSAYDDDREALRAIGIDLDRVRDAVRANLGQDLGDGWGDRPERGPRGRGGRGRGRRNHHHDPRERGERGERGEGERGRGRRGPRSRRPIGPSFSRSLRTLLHDVRRAVLHDRLADDVAGSGGRHGVPGMTGARLLVALTHSDDEVVQAVLATTDDLDGLRAEAEAATHPTAV